MNPGIIAAIIFGSLLLLMATGFPIAFSLLGLTVVGYLVFVGPAALYNVFPITFINITKDIYIAIPLFIFMASILQVSGLGTAMYSTMHKWMAGLKGGLAMGTVAICTLIAAMTGLGGTGTVMMGLLAYPEMRQRGYDKNMALGCIPAGGALGPLIPPSVLMIVVGGFAFLSVGKLFMGGIIPGLMCSFLFMVYIGIRCSRNPELGPALPLEERGTFKEKLISLRGAIAPFLLILLVLGTIYAGICTPTEAGGIGAIGALICAALYRNLNWRNLKEAVATTFRVNCMVLWLVISGSTFASLCGITGVIHFISEVLGGLPIAPMGIVIVMMVMVFIMGMFIEGVAITMITIPIFMPVITQLGFDPLWFGIIFCFNVIIGMITPPFGYNLFYFKGLGHADVSMMDIYRSVVPYVGIMIIVLILCVIFPPILTWLPRMMIK